MNEELLKLVSNKGITEFKAKYSQNMEYYRYNTPNGGGAGFETVVKMFPKVASAWIDRPSCKVSGKYAEKFIQFCLIDSWMSDLRNRGIIKIHQLNRFEKE